MQTQPETTVPETTLPYGTTPDPDGAPTEKDVEVASMAQRLITWCTIGGLALGTYGTFHAVTTLTFGTSPADRPFNSPTFASVHRLAVITVLASQVLQMVGSAALWRRRFMGRTLLITYACIYLSGLILLQVMRAIDTASLAEPSLTSQKAMLALGEMHLVVYGSVFPMFLLVVLTRPWVTRLLRHKGQPIPTLGMEGSGIAAACCDGQPTIPVPVPEKDQKAATERRAA
jgi:hypothetical protein